MVGIRERKTAQTRQRISDHATRLFEQHGFERVTLAQVAEAADVSVKTVTNYFGAKEDLFFDAEPDILDALVDAVRSRGSASPTQAVRPLVLEGPLLAGSCPWRDVGDVTWEAMRTWSSCEHASRTLTARRAAILREWVVPLTDASGSAPWAAMFVGILGLRHDIVQAGLVRGDRPDDVERLVAATVGDALDALERGFRGAR